MHDVHARLLTMGLTGAQSSQKSLPQNLQWWRRLKKVNGALHSLQRSVLSSDSHLVATGSTDRSSTSAERSWPPAWAAPAP